MSDLISREALLEELKKSRKYHAQNGRELELLCRCENIVNEQPTVEAKEAVHGEWIDTQPDYHGGYRRNAYVCSNCHDYYTTEYDDLYFCPRCGADMGKKV